MTNLIPAWACDVFSSHTVMVDGQPVPALTGGSGPDLVLVHGVSGSLNMWRWNAPELARHFRVTMVGLPGPRALQQLRHITRMQNYARWLMEFTQAAGLAPASIAGLSMGGEVALRLASEYASCVNRLILITPAALVPGISLFGWVAVGLRVLFEIPPALIPPVLWYTRWSDIYTMVNANVRMIDPELSTGLASIKAETLVFASNNDPLLPLDLAETYLDRIPSARLAVMPDAGHLVMMSRPELFNQRVREFLSEPARVQTDLPSATSVSPV
ncbi:MAG: alpha/beta hydrolase [Sphaerobacteraceae bacterium]|nr:MAG: alpha/beta hydrolase [Sphaerobacteraceae bacterium]